MSTAVATKLLPVIETFGPTLAGEGAFAGTPTHFVRFGGCEWRCSFCDSKYAVEPSEVRLHAERLSVDDIFDRLAALPGAPAWVTLSGGNPALLDLGPLVELLHRGGYLVAVETQGSRWREWLADVDCLTVSPKPPSSGMATPEHELQVDRFMDAATKAGKFDGGALKVVVFDDADYEWARGTFDAFPLWPAFLSVGTNTISSWGSEVTSAISHRETLMGVAERYAWLAERVARDPAMRHVRAMPQLHLIAFGHARGV